MARHGFITGMMDVKVLVLFVTARAETPLTMQEIYELCYQDEKLSYFDVSDCISFLVRTEHLREVTPGNYVITDKGRQNGSVTEDTVAFTVREKAKRAVEQYNREKKRSKFITAEMFAAEDGTYTARLTLDDEKGRLMTLELMAPNQPQAAVMKRTFQKNAELIYNLLLEDLLDEENFGE